MKFTKLVIIFILFLNFQANANEISVIKFIDINYVFNNSTVGKKINKDGLDQRNKKIKELKKIETDLEKQKNDILSKKNILEKNEFEKKVISHQKKVQDYQLKKNKELTELKQKNIKFTKNFMKKVDQVLLKYAENNKIDLILAREVLVISHSKLDISKDILEIVNKEIKKVE
tara:strand:+ start:186 stop:704 length:519 start_codon:yes stop_codon:yes gene_type:complete